MVGTLLYLLLLALLFTLALAIVLLPVLAIAFYAGRRKRRSESARGGALVNPGESLLCSLENSNG